MEDVRTGARYRALRVRLGWRQADLATRAGVSQGLVSLVERGRLEEVGLRHLRRIARELDAELGVFLRWRGGDLDRLIDEGHASLVGMMASLLSVSGWEVRVEVTYAIYRERGSIDVLAFHPGTRTLLVVEVKTELVSVEETLRKHDEKVRLSRRVAGEQLGWHPASVARLLVLPSLATQRRRVDRHAAALAPAYPFRGGAVRAWIASPSGGAGGILFLDTSSRERSGGRRVISRKRVRKPATAAAGEGLRHTGRS